MPNVISRSLFTTAITHSHTSPEHLVLITNFKTSLRSKRTIKGVASQRVIGLLALPTFS